MTLHNPADGPLITLRVDDDGRLGLHLQEGGNLRVVHLSPLAEQSLRDQAAEALASRAERQTAMEVQVSALRYASYGDHAQLNHAALAYDPTETVEALVLRGLKLAERYGQAYLDADHIVLRVVEGTEPDRPGSDVPPF